MWRRYVPLTQWHLHTTLRGVTNEKTIVGILGEWFAKKWSTQCITRYQNFMTMVMKFTVPNQQSGNQARPTSAVFLSGSFLKTPLHNSVNSCHHYRFNMSYFKTLTLCLELQIRMKPKLKKIIYRRQLTSTAVTFTTGAEVELRC